jgi:hypothetical protein
MSRSAETALYDGCWDVAAGQRLRPPASHEWRGRMVLPGAGRCCGQEAAMPSPPMAPGTVTEPVSVSEPPGPMR